MSDKPKRNLDQRIAFAKNTVNGANASGSNKPDFCAVLGSGQVRLPFVRAYLELINALTEDAPVK